MGKEIERKFLVINTDYRLNSIGIEYKQGYLSIEHGCIIRVRTCGGKGYITIKNKPSGLTRSEFEYGIPYNDALELLETLSMKPIIEKTRYRCPYAGHIWEIDEFKGENEGLVIAEIELQSEHEEFLLPGWVGDEVTFDPKYRNSNLIKHPYKNWA